MDAHKPANHQGASDLSVPVKGSLLRQVAQAIVLALVVAAASSAALWLLLGRPSIRPENEVAGISDLFDGLRISLAIVAGLGAVVALVVAYRKQRLTEAQHALTTNADKRESTKLFGERFKSASEQLGSKESAIRLAGVYAMLNLANDWLAGRQMCVNVLCGYLRMPFDIDRGDEDINPIRSTKVEPELSPTPAPTVATATEDQTIARLARRQEFQVRLAIQRTLAAHLRNPDRKHSERQEILEYWPETRLDLFGATLCNLDLEGCEISWVDFRTATFIGDANFSDIRILHEANFSSSTFLGKARFVGADFNEHADFCDVQFEKEATMVGAKFGADGEFNQAIFGGKAEFDASKFGAGAWFPGATFEGLTSFRNSTAKDGHHFQSVKVVLPKLAHTWPPGVVLMKGALLQAPLEQ